MGIFNRVLDTEKRLLLIDGEIEQLKSERNELFTAATVSDTKLKELYLDIEIKKLERLYVKRQQLFELRASTEQMDSKLLYLQQLGKLNTLNERCIQLIVKRLSEEGYASVLKRSGFLPERTPMQLNAKLR